MTANLAHNPNPNKVFDHSKGFDCVKTPDRRTSVLSSVLDAVGNTPLIELHTVPKMLGLKCRVLAKCEFFNPGGSVKDRIGRLMLLDAIDAGQVSDDTEVIEASSGNTGTALAMATAAKGKKFTITMPIKMSTEKATAMAVLGAQVVRTPNVPSSHPDSLVSTAARLHAERPDQSIILNQYANSANPNAHYYGTGQEIFEQSGGKVDYVVMGMGTGGTMSGTAKRLKECIPDIKVVGVDPVGSILADPDVPAPNVSYQVEGIGYDFIPETCHRGLVDEWVKSEDPLSLRYARMLQKHEGLLCGASSGSALFGATEIAQKFDLGPEHTIVVLLPDGVRNYMTKFADDNWLVAKGFSDIVKDVGGMQPTRPTYEQLEQENLALKKRLAEMTAAAPGNDSVTVLNQIGIV